MFLNPTYFSITNKLSSYFTNNFIKRINNDEINKYDLFIFDMNGVLRINNKPINLAINSFNNLINNNKKICILTNECRTSPKFLRSELINMGFKLNKNIELISSSKLTLIKIDEILNNLNINIRHKNKKNNIYDNKKLINIGLVGTKEFYFYIKKKIQAKYLNIFFYWIKDDNIIPEKLNYLIIGNIENDYNIDTTYSKVIDNGIKWFKNNNNFDIIFSYIDKKDDIVKDYFKPLQYFDILSAELKKNNINPIINNKIYLGKPYCSEYIDYIYSRYKLNKENKSILMVGDNIETDMEFAENINGDACLVLSGVTKHKDLNYNNTKNIKYIIPDISYIN